MRLPGLYFVMAMICASVVALPLPCHAEAGAKTPSASGPDQWVVYEPLMPPYSVMRIVNVMTAIQKGLIYSKKHMAITYEYRAAVNDGLAGCAQAGLEGQTAWFVTTIDDRVHEVTFSRDDNGALVATPDTIMAGPYPLDIKWGCFRDMVFLANISGQSAAGKEACRTPIPYG